MHDEGHISLPALQSDLSQQQQVQIHGGRSAARRAMAAGREGLNIVNRYRILIVDDDAMAREFLKRILEHAGYEVMTAGSGPEALRKLHEGIPHLVVVDLMMPEMDGFELCRRIKTTSTSPSSSSAPSQPSRARSKACRCTPRTTSSSHSKRKSWSRACSGCC